MIVLILLTILILFLIFTSIALNEEASFFSWLVTIVIILWPIGSIALHASDLATVRHGQLLVEVRQEAISQINKQLKEIKVSPTALMNADSPTSSLINTKANFVKELTEQKIAIQEAKVSIERRSIGLMYGIVKIMGKE